MGKVKLLTREQVEAMHTPLHQATYDQAAATIEALAADLRWALHGLDLLSASCNHPTADNIRSRWKDTGFLEGK